MRKIMLIIQQNLFPPSLNHSLQIYLFCLLIRSVMTASDLLRKSCHPMTWRENKCTTIQWKRLYALMQLLIPCMTFPFLMRKVITLRALITIMATHQISDWQ